MIPTFVQHLWYLEGAYFSDGVPIPEPPAWEEQEWCDHHTCQHEYCQNMLAVMYGDE